ncbi:MAG: hypothetical protein IT342_23120 [Candidatus Melainabacteria bacterium]|nr:hypothetical protein [Candidatus Melainabacteria bacterium]
MFKVVASFLFCILVASSAIAADIIEVTVYHNGELNSTTGKTWLGLFPAKGGQFELREAKVSVSLVNDPIADNSPKEKTGRKVTVAGTAEPLVVIAGVSALKPGKVVTSTVNMKERFDVGEKLKLNVGTRESTFTVTGVKKNAEWRIGYKVVLESGGIKQTIYEREQVADSSFPSLLWAGDLDGDQKIDLIMDTTDNYNVRNLTLFLSSKAKPGKLVEQVATHMSTGC